MTEDRALSRRNADLIAEGFVSGLLLRDLRPAAVIAFTAGNSWRLLAAVLGCLRAGYAPVMLSAALTESERTGMLASVKPALVVDEWRCAELARAPESWMPQVGLDDYFHCRPIHFTSGTSGEPKAVWSGWLNADDSRSSSAEEAEAWGFGVEDRHLVCSPLSHSAPLRFALHTLLAGGRVIVPSRFDAPAAADLIASGVVTTTFMAPAHVQRLLASAPFHAPRLRLLTHAGSPCPEHVKRKAIAVFGADAVVEFYGSTEDQFTLCRTEEWLQRPGTVGRARPGREIRTADGQIWCRTPPYARFEYYGDPVKTAAAWQGDWFTVRDLGRLDEDGYLWASQRPDHQRRRERLPGRGRAGARGDQRRGQGLRLRCGRPAVGPAGLRGGRRARLRAGDPCSCRVQARALQASQDDRSR